MDLNFVFRGNKVRLGCQYRDSKVPGNIEVDLLTRSSEGNADLGTKLEMGQIQMLRSKLRVLATQEGNNVRFLVAGVGEGSVGEATDA